MGTTVISQECTVNASCVTSHRWETSPTSHATPTIFVINDDASVRESLELLIQDVGWNVETFASAQQFLARSRAAGPCCLILDVRLPDLNGLELQVRMASERRDLPIIFLTGPTDIPTTVKAMKAGAVEFFTKPFQDDLLLSAIRDALERSRFTLDQQAKMKELRKCYASLSRRERQVMALVSSGLLNKQVGCELGISEVTVKAHRGRVMKKMQANSLSDLVRMAARLHLTRHLTNAFVEMNP